MLLTSLFTKKRVLTGRVIKEWEHNSWGNNVHWSDYEQLRVVGWLWHKPVENDEMQFKMRRPDGTEVVTRYITTEVEDATGVDDMFFATVKPFAYVGQPITDRSIKEPSNAN